MMRIWLLNQGNKVGHCILVHPYIMLFNNIFIWILRERSDKMICTVY